MGPYRTRTKYRRLYRITRRYSITCSSGLLTRDADEEMPSLFAAGQRQEVPSSVTPSVTGRVCAHPTAIIRLLPDKEIAKG